MAQTFNNTYVLTNPASASWYDYNHMDLSVHTGDGYIKVGFLSENVDNPDPAYFEVYISVTKVDPTGNIMWSRKIGKSNYDVWPGAITRSHSPGYSIIVGTKDPKAGSTTTAGNAIAFKIDNATGAIVWELEFNTGFFNNGLLVQEVPNNQYVLVGEWQHNSSPMMVQAINFDDLGNMGWAMRYETPTEGHGTPTAICYRPTQGVVKVFGINPNHTSTYTIGLDPNSGFIAESYRLVTYGGSLIETAGFIQPTSDDGYIMGMHAQAPSGGGFGQPHAILVKVDNTLAENISWSKKYPETWWGLAVYEDPNIALQYDFAVEVDNGNGIPVPALLTVNSLGTAINLMMYDHPYGTKTHCMTEGIQSGTYMINASYLNTKSNASGFQLVATDISDAAPCHDPLPFSTQNQTTGHDPRIFNDYSGGTGFDPDLSNVGMAFSIHPCNAPFKKSTDIETALGEGIQLFPNPAQDQLTVKGLNSDDVEITVFDALGRKVTMTSTINGQGNVQFDLSTLDRGGYVMNIHRGEKVSTYQFFKM